MLYNSYIWLFLAISTLSIYNIYMKKLIVDEKYDGKKLNRFLLDSLPNLNSNLLYKTLRKKDIKVNNRRVNENINVYNGDEILVYISDEY